MTRAFLLANLAVLGVICALAVVGRATPFPPHLAEVPDICLDGLPLDSIFTPRRMPPDTVTTPNERIPLEFDYR